MILTTHMLAGAAAASKISNPFLALPLALLSHSLCDFLPHNDYSIINIVERRWNKTHRHFVKIFLDISLGTLLILLFSDNNPIIFAGAFIAIVPDGITLLSKIFPQNKLAALHQVFHALVNKVGDLDGNKKIPVFWGILSQIIIVSISIVFLR